MPYLVEETFELVDALEALDPDDPATDEALIEELGDLLYQIEFHATIAEQAGRFSIADVTAGIHDKLVRRHPHVFGDVDGDDAGTVIANWDEIKREEKGRTSVFDGVARSLPALAYAQHLARKAAKVGFDWPDVDGPLAKVDEELAELREAIAGGDAGADRRRARRPGHRRRQRRPPPRRRRRAGGARRGRQVPPPLRGGRGAGRGARASTCAPPTWRRSTRCGTRSRPPSPDDPRLGPDPGRPGEQDRTET